MGPTPQSANTTDDRSGSWCEARTAAWIGKQVELALTDVDLTSPQYRVLSLLDEGSSMSSALAARLAVRPPSVTSVIDGLVTRHLVIRCQVDGDRRRVSLVLTDEGRRLLHAADRAVDGRLRAIAGSLPAPDLRSQAMGAFGLWDEAMARYHRARSS